MDASAPNPTRYVVVANPATHGNVDHIIQAIRAAAPHGVTIDVSYTDRVVPLADLTDFGASDIAGVIAVGGDGTVRAVATALGDRKLPIGIIPGGSTNIIAQELKIPKQPNRAAALIFGEHCLYSMDAGVCGGDRFLHMAGAGLDSRFFAATDPELKRRIGWRAYLRPAVNQLSASPIRFRIEADQLSVEVDSPLVLIANGRSILKPFLPIYPDVRSDDGWLDVIVFTPSAFRDVVLTAAGFALRRLEQSPYVMRIKTKHVKLSADPPFPVQLDGDLYGETPISVDIQPGALTIIVPKRRTP